MTSERFGALLDACGADFRRWPEAEREAGRALAAAGSPEIRARLAAAAAIDSWLDSHVVAAADAVLVQRIEAGAVDASRLRAVDASAGHAGADAGAGEPPATTNPGRSHTRSKRSPRWPSWLWPGIGLAGIGLAGTLAGALGVSAILRFAAPPAALDFPERVTAFSELPADWSEE